jgi:hypothetical protein
MLLFVGEEILSSFGFGCGFGAWVEWCGAVLWFVDEIEGVSFGQ